MPFAVFTCAQKPAVLELPPAIPSLKRATELNKEGCDVFDEREELIQALNCLEGGRLAELENSITERKNLQAEVKAKLESLLSDVTHARLSKENLGAAAKSSHDEFEDLQKRKAEVSKTGNEEKQ